jgi:hypothetical protein
MMDYEKTTKIAKHLGAWQSDPECQLQDHRTRSRYVVNYIGVGRPYKVILIKDWNKTGMTTISGAFPRRLQKYYNQGDSYSINVGNGRDPKAIARDIERRFMPAYKADWKRREQYARASDQRELKRLGIVSEILQASEGMLSVVEYGDDSYEKRLTYDAGEPHLDVRITHDSMRFEYSKLTLKQALELVDLAKSWKEETK